MSKHATLYRMMTDKHICPFGLRAKDLLERKGYEVTDVRLNNREQTDEFKNKYDVKTTPQAFIDDQRIGGYDDLRSYFNMAPAVTKGLTYRPVLTIFAIAFLLALVQTHLTGSPVLAMATLLTFVAYAMVLLALQKLQDLYSFTNSFITYDLLAMRYLRYGYLYPFLEAYAGLAMLAGLPALYVAPVSIFIGLIGGISVIKAVYIDQRELKCACVGGNSNVPLGFVSLTENVFMFLAGIWMLATSGIF